jgi:hypothetical protein
MIKNKIKPLDLIVFRGDDPVSDTIAEGEKMLLGNGQWSHCGIVITHDIVPFNNGVDGKLYVWESTMSGKLGGGPDDVETGTWKFGVQIRDLEQVIDAYDNDPTTRIGWCPLRNNPLDRKAGEDEKTWLGRVDQLKKLLTTFNEQKGNETYNYNLIDLGSTVSNFLFKCGRCCGSADKLFCSELVAFIYQLIGVLSNSTNAVQVAPVTLLGFDGKPVAVPIRLPAVVITREWSAFASDNSTVSYTDKDLDEQYKKYDSEHKLNESGGLI